MAEVKKAKGSKKNRKHGRNAAWCRAYEARHQRERNRLRRLAKHLATYPNDRIAYRAVARWQAEVRPRAAA